MNNHLANYFKNTSPEQHEKYLAEAKNHLGIWWDKNRSVWEVKIKGVRVGRFSDFCDAAKAQASHLKYADKNSQRKSSKSATGVCLDKTRSKWEAKIDHKTLGWFDSFDCATKALEDFFFYYPDSSEVEFIAVQSGVSTETVFYWLVENPQLFSVVSAGVKNKSSSGDSDTTHDGLSFTN